MANHLREETLSAAFKNEQRTEDSPWTDLVQAGLAGLALVLLSPLLLLISLAVKLTSPGPVLYRGARVGKNGRIFTIHKFRTLRDGTEQQIGARLLNEKDDILYTPIGRFLKRTKLDELPQLWNVLQGDMRFVGPRPVRPIFLEQLTTEIPGYRERFRVKPGMTGLAQVCGGYFTHPRNKLRYERLYIRHQSLALDCKIMLYTLLKICHRWLSLGFLLLVLFLFVSFIPASLLSSFYLSIWGVRFNVVHGLIAFCGVWLLGRQLPHDRLALYRIPLYLPMGLFLLCSLTGMFFSLDPIQALRGAAYYLVTGFLITLGIANANITRRFVHQAVNVVAATAVIISAIGLLKLLLVDYLTSAEAAPQIGTTFFSRSPAVTATLGSPSVLAAYLTLAVPFLLCRLAQAQKRQERDLWVVGATLTFIGILLTKTPLGLCALVLTVALYMGRYFRPAMLTGFVFAVSPFFYLSLLHSSVPPLRELVSLPAGGWQGMLGHTSLFYALFGYGARTLKESWPGIEVASDFPAPPDNAYLTLLLENGLVGVAAMLWIVTAALICIYRAHREAQDEETRHILWAAFCSMVGFLVSLIGCNAFANLTLQVLFWGTMGIGLGVVTHLSGKRRELLLDLKLGH